MRARLRARVRDDDDDDEDDSYLHLASSLVASKRYCQSIHVPCAAFTFSCKISTLFLLLRKCGFSSHRNSVFDNFECHSLELDAS